MNNSMEIMERCAVKFCQFNSEELKKTLYSLVAKTPYNYEEISDYLTEFANRGHYDFVYDFLFNVPLNFSVESCKKLGDVVEDMPLALLSGYGSHIKLQYKLYQYGVDRSPFLYAGEYLNRLGVKRQMKKIRNICWTPHIIFR